MTLHQPPANVVITGVGPVSAMGFGIEALSEGLLSGVSGIDDITLFDPEPYGSGSAGEIPTFNVEDYLDSQKTYLDRSSEVAFAAIRLALEDAALTPEALADYHAGIALGSVFGCQSTAELFYADLLEKGPRLVKPILFPNAYPNTTISLLAIEYGLDGMHLNFASGFTSSFAAISAAYDHIRSGKSPLVLAGGCEVLSESIFYGFRAAGRLSPNDGNAERCSPFDEAANGFIAGEGAGIFVLESEEHARRRDARVRAEIAAVGCRGVPPSVSAGLFRADSQDNFVGRAMRDVLTTGGATPDHVDCVFAHADGERLVDDLEAQACSDLSDSVQTPIPVTTTKPFTGECMGAGGAMQLAAALAAMEKAFIPPVCNLKNASPRAKKLDLPAETARSAVLRHVLVNSIDAGGNAVSMLLKKGPSGKT